MVYFGHVMGGSTGWWGHEMELSGTRRAGPNRGPVESTPGLGPDRCQEIARALDARTIFSSSGGRTMRLTGWRLEQGDQGGPPNVRDRRFLRQNNKSSISMSTPAHPLPRRHWLRVSLGANNDIITNETIGAIPEPPPLEPRHRKTPRIRICASALSSDDCPPSHQSPAQTVGIQVSTLCLAFRAAVAQALRSLPPSPSRRPVELHDAAP